MLKPKRKLTLIILALAMVLFPVLQPVPVQARGLVPCGGYNVDGSREHPCTVRDIFYLIARVTNWLISLSAVFAVYKFVNAGFWLVVSSGNEENITKWRKSLANAVVGFFIVVMAYVFMNSAVNLILANNDKCKQVSLSDPLTYVSLQPSSECLNKQ